MGSSVGEKKQSHEKQPKEQERRMAGEGWGQVHVKKKHPHPEVTPKTLKRRGGNGEAVIV